MRMLVFRCSTIQVNDENVFFMLYNVRVLIQAAVKERIAGVCALVVTLQRKFNLAEG